MSLRPYVVHICFKQYLGEMCPSSCRCVKRVTAEERKFLLDYGLAEKVLVRRIVTDRTIERVCPICEGHKTFVRSCLNCQNTGKIYDPVILEEFSENIVMTVSSFLAAGEKFVIVQDALRIKTPRVETIERPHIERAYLPLRRFGKVWGYEKDTPMDADRIEEWGWLNSANLVRARILFSCVECGHQFTETYPSNECFQCGKKLEVLEKIPPILTYYWPELYDPFKERPVLLLIGWDQRSQPGKDVDKNRAIW